MYDAQRAAKNASAMTTIDNGKVDQNLEISKEEGILLEVRKSQNKTGSPRSELENRFAN